jgi:transposase
VPLTDAQWARIEPLLPDRTPKRGGRRRDHREVIDAIAFKFQTGTQWVHLPENPVDSTIVRAHQHAAGARKKGPRPASRTITPSAVPAAD